MAKINIPTENISESSKEEMRAILSTLAQGGRVRLGEFGDNVVSTEADEIAMVLYEIVSQL